MRAAFAKRHNKVKILDVPIPKPKWREVLIKIDVCGVCGSDFIEAQSWAKKWKRFGHEIAATVEETGEEVVGLSAGDQVVVALSVPCNNCDSCINSYPRGCKSLIVAEQGGFAEYLLIKDYRLLCKVSPPLPSEIISLTEPLTVILDAFDLAKLKRGDNILIVGGGGIGRMSLLAAKALGINVLGTLGRKRNDGLDVCLSASKGSFFPWHTFAGMIRGMNTDLKHKLSALSGRLVVLHTAPPRYISKYINSLPFDSTIVNIGLSASRNLNLIRLNASMMLFKRIQLMNSFPVPCMYLSRAVSIISENFDLFSLLSPMPVPLEQLPDILKSGRSGHKIVIKMQS
jgi:threonine dehydrogenase-like Zn-dependent dehydrogenase